MRMSSFRNSTLSVLSGIAFTLVAATVGPLANAKTSVTVAVAHDIASWNPYADSTAGMYAIWCQVYGCLGTYDGATGTFKGMLAESWEVDKNDPNKWTFRLRKGLKRHGDGKELTAADVAHSIWRNKNDKRTAQAHNTRAIKSWKIIDKYTIQFVTKKPIAPLLSYLFDLFFITGKDIYDKHGSRNSDRKYPLGWGPYMLKDIKIGERMVLEKNPNWPGIKKSNPDRIIFQRVKEPEARVTGLLNGEFQIAPFIPSHLVPRVAKSSSARIYKGDSVESMFLGMNGAFKPWDNILARKAVAHAIDRELIIKTIFKGGASILHGPVGKGQYGWNPAVGPKYDYNPKKARALLEKAGLVGTEIDFYCTTGRYEKDRVAAQAMVPMLEAVGFKVKLHTPEYSSHWPLVRKGKRPFYYHGRGSIIDPSPAIYQYFQTGVTPRIKYSNLELDKTLVAERAEFVPEKREKLLQKAFGIILEDVPAHFLWRINTLYGLSNKLDYVPTPHNRVYGHHIFMR
jgi:peptide/nickel transport system substrate-binding protein